MAETKKAAAKAAPAKAAAKDEVKAAPKAEAKAEVKEAPKTEAKVPVKKAAPAKKATPAKKAASAKKEEPAKKETAKKSEVKQTVNFQFSGKSYTPDDLLGICKDVWKYDLNGKEEDFKSVELYVKPEENTTYYVINGEVTGSFFI